MQDTQNEDYSPAPAEGTEAQEYGSLAQSTPSTISTTKARHIDVEDVEANPP